ncbi:uncharacterized protein LOC144442314 [Glandiceps talaboti]
MSFMKKGSSDETKSILHQDTDYWDTSSPRLIYVQKRSKVIWFVIALLLMVSIAAIVLSIVTLNAYKTGSLQKSVTFVWYEGKFDSHVSVDKELQTEKMEIPMTLIRNGNTVTGKAQLVHDFKAEYTAYKVTVGDASVCYIDKLNSSYVMYNPQELFNFLEEYKDQVVQRAPRVGVSYSADNSKEMTGLSMLNSPEITELCIDATKSYLLGPGKETARRLRRYDNSACLFNFSLWGADIKVGCVDFDFHLFGDK